ncbi:MAG: hypothetical protein IIA33_09775, partial [Planctomycetes bacterium]|nr:hypothetical protein [Planctomycetota bacterium]
MLTVLSAVIATAIPAAWTYSRMKYRERRRRQNAEEAARITKENEGDPKTGASPSAELLRSAKQQIRARVAASPNLSKEKIEDEIETNLGELNKRLERIEAGAPEGAKLEKATSQHD